MNSETNRETQARSAEEERRELREADIEQYIHDLAVSAPPLSSEDCSRIAQLLWPVEGGAR
ncbi:hypothetical protein FHS43_006183 [Streptosporangium becharense]|uniref:Uncharacterized protein n=1 Tax=Streptosporangium becharense TaxID=1816182 RepID=A0A7W9MHC6_9ACTN|nr:hypothetical protein [Streptosporangium becharense]MBB5820318.1 hypothetical protein [Streptosporangium becharense]